MKKFFLGVTVLFSWFIKTGKLNKKPHWFWFRWGFALTRIGRTRCGSFYFPVLPSGKFASNLMIPSASEMEVNPHPVEVVRTARAIRVISLFFMVCFEFDQRLFRDEFDFGGFNA